MTRTALLAPDLAEYRFALYCRSNLAGISHEPQPPVALYRDQASARIQGLRMWPSTFEVIDLHGEHDSCGNRS